MKRYLVAAAALSFISTFTLIGIAAAQEAEVDYSWGIVAQVSEGQIAVTEYDYEKDQETDVVYSIDPNVKLENAASLEDIAAGDSVDIEYAVEGGKRVAKVIAVDKSGEESEPAETYMEGE